MYMCVCMYMYTLDTIDNLLHPLIGSLPLCLFSSILILLQKIKITKVGRWSLSSSLFIINHFQWQLPLPYTSFLASDSSPTPNLSHHLIHSHSISPSPPNPRSQIIAFSSIKLLYLRVYFVNILFFFTQKPSRFRLFSMAAEPKESPANNPGLHTTPDEATKGYFMQQTVSLFFHSYFANPLITVTVCMILKF